MDNKLIKSFDFDDFMYGVRRHGVFNGETLADNIPDAAVPLFEAAFADLLARIAELEAKLATPVRLPPIQSRHFFGLQVDSYDARQTEIAIGVAGFIVDGATGCG